MNKQNSGQKSQQHDSSPAEILPYCVCNAILHLMRGRFITFITNVRPALFMTRLLLCFALLFSFSTAHAAGSYTLEFEYHPSHLHNPDTADNASDVSHAITRHYDGFRDPSDTVDTVLFIDGLKRVVQTKKDQTVAGTSMMVASGRVIFDYVGRVVEQHYPDIELKGNDRVFNSFADPVTPTRYTYDVLDRQTQIQIPDRSITQMYYGFGSDRHGLLQFETRVVDAERKEKRTYKA
ncbi:MAG: hypothetical protein JKY19_00225 [Alcanivoracaceae bacterium]|nr:hypothetical protein [Alcanivoracaceae bacterium]